ncbi:site-specific DNA-methyltransferase [Pelagibius sp.]|uniref:DNA-methyltransferase n=1 Tax=Pelagibius sp. TaxID=1931238 RepID=UPI002629643B|nr:site-specific DNA-methyltransferase [Pelagibius sp.]
MAVRLLVGDALEHLRTLADESVDSCICSPPYWGLRDYGVEGQMGLEASLGEHLEAMVGVFAEVHRVLKPGGVLWLNYGDCYAAEPNGRSAAETKAKGGDDRTFRDKPMKTTGPIHPPVAGKPFETPKGAGRRGGGKNAAGPVFDADYRQRTTGGLHLARREDVKGRVVAGGYLKPGDLCMVPNRLAIALQEWGWWVKAECVWAKPNAMPDSSGVSRPATAHEKIFMLTKSDRVNLWRARDTGEISYDPDHSEMAVMKSTKDQRLGKRWIAMRHHYDAEAVRVPADPESLARYERGRSDDHKWADGGPGGQTIARSFRGMRQPKDKQRGHAREHAGFKERWDQMTREEQQANGRLLRNYEPAPPVVWEMPTASFAEAHYATFPPELVERCIRAGCPMGGTVLDPFGGAGTTGLVAEAMGRNAILIELHPDYARMARRRIRTGLGRVEADLPDDGPEGLPLFGGASR